MNQTTRQTKAFYDRVAQTYAEASCRRTMTDVMKPFLEVIHPESLVLDLGSGAGRDSLALEACGHAVVSLDISAGLLREHQSRGGRWLIQADMAHLPFPDNRFHGVWACASLLHIPKPSIEKILRGIRRILLPGGVLFVSLKLGVSEGTHVDDSGKFLPRDQPHGERYWSFYETEEWLAYLQQAGFTSLWVSETPDISGRELSWLNNVSMCKKGRKVSAGFLAVLQDVSQK